jgi:hypothetical protein
MTLKSIDPLGLEKSQAEHLQDLDQGNKTNGEWNVAGPALEHEPPAPPGTTFLPRLQVRGSAPGRAGPAISRPGSRPGEEVLGLMGEVAIGAGEGAVVGAGVAVGCAATGPAAGACMGAAVAYGAYSLWESRGELASNPYEAARTIGGMSTIVPSAKFSRAQLATVPEHALFSGPKWKGKTDYSHIPNPKNLNASTRPTPRQVREMKAANRAHNGGVLRSDATGKVMQDSAKSKSGVTPPSNEAQVDHMTAVSKGGTRAQSNLQLLTRKENRTKSNR